MMMRRSVLIAGIVAAVILAGAIAVLNFFPANVGEQQGQQGQEPLPTPAADLKTDLINEATEDIVEIRFMPFNGSPYSIIQFLSDSEQELILQSDDALFPGRPAVMRLIFNYAISLRNVTQITENADDTQLSMFGFDDPVMIWQAVRSDGTIIELAAGSMQAAGQGHYVRLKDSREVFLLGGMQSEYLTLQLEDLYDFTFYPYPPTQENPETWSYITHLLLERSNDTIEILQRTDDEMTEAGSGASRYKIVQPVIGDCNDFMVQTVLMENVLRIMPDSVIEELPIDLTVYGLDSPVKLTVSTSQWIGTVLIGNRSAQHGGQYIMIEGVDAVLLDRTGDYSFVNTDATQLRTRIIWMHNIAGVSSVTYVLDGNTRILELEHVSEDGLIGKLDGVELSETNTRRLFMYTLSISQTGGINIAIPSGAPDYSITMQFIDGSTDMIELYSLNDAQFLIVYNGENTGFYITRMTLQQNLLNRFDSLDKGEDLLIY